MLGFVLLIKGHPQKLKPLYKKGLIKSDGTRNTKLSWVELGLPENTNSDNIRKIIHTQRKLHGD